MAYGPFAHQYPYSNFHDLNLDWILNVLKNWEARLEQFVSLNTVKYANPIQWNITSQYSTNTIVVDPQTGTAYLSVQPVPRGVQLSDTEYWAPVFTLAGLVQFLKDAIATGQQTLGQPATVDIPNRTVFWVGDQLVIASVNIPSGTVIVPGTNCNPVPVVDLTNEVYNTAYAVYDPSTPTVKLGWVRTAPSVPTECDTHYYSGPDETIRIVAKR